MTEPSVPRNGPLEPERPAGGGLCPDVSGLTDPVLIQVLEALNSQSQLLIDLLAAVNGLTSALLCRQR